MNKHLTYSKAAELLNTVGQGHLLAFYEQLDDRRKEHLLEQIAGLDSAQIPVWVENYVKNPRPVVIPENFTPAPSYEPKSASPQQHKKYDHAKQLGRKLISTGKVAAFTVAGGQGTRLGFAGPKGDYPISPLRNKTLFQLFAETILAASRKYHTNLAWYVMTSRLNHTATVELFRANDYYGLSKSDVFIFQQAALPNFDQTGKILLADKSTIATSPDGHGGSLKALYNSGAIADMKGRGVEYISYFQVDNPLINIFDALFIGLHAVDGAEMSSKALKKAHPTEKVGNFCLVDGRPAVIEYSDLPDQLAKKKNPDGSLVFELGSIAIHIISTAFVEKLNLGGFALPIHRAVKKIPHIDTQGGSVTPTEPNGIKLETFVFDALPLASKSIILQTIRSEEFAPVKNAGGTNSPQAARRMMTERSTGWLESAGITLPRKADGSADCVIEIAPGFAICPEDLIAKKDQLPQIRPGDEIYLAINSL